MSRRPPLLHAALGTALLAVPDAVLRRAGWSTGDRAGALAVRVLGIRHLGQAVALWLWPGRSSLRLGGTVDVLHGVSMAVLAAVGGSRRRAALASMLAAGALAAVQFTEANHG
jgi:hypothetical protein